MDNYYTDEFGVIHQKDRKPFVYDQEYLDYYEGIKERTVRLGYLRMGYLMGKMHKNSVHSILEIGYGSGSFLSAAQECGFNCYGHDINRFPLPDGCSFVEWDEVISKNGSWGCVAMFDVLEHIPDLSFLSKLNAKYLAISVPCCRYKELGKGEDWFMNWRMRRPDEHLHHFSGEALNKFISSFGYTLVDTNHMEDGMRLREGEDGPNIITALFEKTTGSII